MTKLRNLMLFVSVGFISAGCAGTTPESSLFGDKRVTTASANQMFDKNFESFSDEKLVSLLDPEGTGSVAGSSGGEMAQRLDLAFLHANKVDSSDPSKAEARRSQIQDRLIAASNQRCNLYTTYLKRISEYTNGIFGVTTTLLGGAGAIVTGENAARTLSGLAGISSGTRAELNQAVFESLTTSVIVPAIRLRREEILQSILAKRTCPLTKYTVEGAIADVVNYHGACSIDTGIAYAEKSIQSYDDIGVKKFKEIDALLKRKDASENSANKGKPSGASEGANGGRSPQAGQSEKAAKNVSNSGSDKSCPL